MLFPGAHHRGQAAGGTQDPPFFKPLVLFMRMCVREHVKVCIQLLGDCGALAQAASEGNNVSNRVGDHC